MIESMSRFSEYFKEGITVQEAQCPERPSPEYDALSLFIIYTMTLKDKQRNNVGGWNKMTQFFN